MAKTTIPTAGLADAAVTTAKITDANITTAKIADDAVTAAKATGHGKLAQLVSAQQDGGGPSTSSTSYVDMTGLTVNITPTASDSKILCMVAVNGLSAANDNLDAISIQLLYDSTVVTLIENALYQTGTGGENENVTLMGVVTSGGTDQVTVKSQFKNRQANAVSFNATTNDESDIVVMEILA
jgi:trimeric autotransporter adhesin